MATMVKSGTATITAKTGPDVALTAQVITNVTGLNIDFAKGIVNILNGDPTKNLCIQGSNLGTLTINTSTGAIAIST